MAPLRYHDQLAALASQHSQLATPVADRLRVDTPPLVGDEARADLDDDAACSAQRLVHGAAIGLCRNRTSSISSPARDARWRQLVPRGLDQRLQTFARHRRHDKHSALPAQATRDVAHQHATLLERQSGRSCSEPASAACDGAPRRTCAARSTRPAPERPGRTDSSSGATSTTCHSSRVRCRWRRKWWPRPAPSAAPSISPGMSATTKLRLGPSAHHTEVWMQGGERIVGNLGPRVGDCRDQCRLAGVGHAEQADIGKHAQFQLQLALFTRPARRFLPRTSDWCCS
mgnify:CR=1 FL=1